MERFGKNGRGEKRGREGWVEAAAAADGLVEEPSRKQRKVPALASVIVEALKVDSLQRLCSSMEPLLRRIVSEEVERALTKIGHTKLTARSSPPRIEGPEGRKLQLQFTSRMPPHLFTGGKVEGDQGTAIHVVLLDANTGMVVPLGPESMAKLTVVVLEGDFNEETDDDWSAEHFENFEVKEREGKRPLLTGDLQVTLKEGVGTLGDLIFTDNSSWIRSRKFRLGVKVAAGVCESTRIREAKTEAFAVKDHRGELYKKHYPPALHDEVWRLDRIAKDGALHKKLVSAQILTVEDFLRLLVRDAQKLRSILGSGMSNRMWENTVEHAKTCVLSEKLYVYYSDSARSTGVVFNHIYELRGLITNGQFLSVDFLSDSQKVSVDHLVKRAYDNWNQVIEYDGQVLLNSMSTSKKTQRSQPTKGYNASMDNLYLPASDSQNYYASVPGSQLQTERDLNSSSSLLALATPQISSGYHMSGDWPNSGDGRDYDDFISEEEIRLRSSEILEHDDMQNLLRSFGMGIGGGFNSTNEACYSYADPSLASQGVCGFGQERNRSNGKAVVGWLKLKAAFRWGIFVRKRAAERRAQLEELD